MADFLDQCQQQATPTLVILITYTTVTEWPILEYADGFRNLFVNGCS